MTNVCYSVPRFAGALGRPFQSAEIPVGFQSQGMSWLMQKSLQGKDWKFLEMDPQLSKQRLGH